MVIGISISGTGTFGKLMVRKPFSPECYFAGWTFNKLLTGPVPFGVRSVHT